MSSPRWWALNQSVISVSASTQERVKKQLARNIPAFQRLARFAPYVAGDSFTLDMDRALCRDMINQTVFATAQDDSKPILTGVLLELGESIDMVATDAYQFAKRSAPLLLDDGAPRSTRSIFRRVVERSRHLIRR